MRFNVPDCLKTQKMWDKVVEKDPKIIRFILGCFKTQEISEIVIFVESGFLSTIASF